MTEKTARILLASVILARSSSFVLVKISLKDMETFNLMGLRFLLAFVIMYVLFFRRIHTSDLKNILSGIAVGAVYFIVMTFEVSSLKTCDSSTTAFLENTAIVMVPLFEAVLLKKLPLPKTFLSLFLAVTGVALMTIRESFSSFSAGHILAFSAAVTYAVAIILTDRLTKHADALVIGIVQLGTMGILSTAASFLLETPYLPSTAGIWIAVIFLSCVCSCFGFTLQTVAQKYTSAETAGLYCAFGPLGAGIFGRVFLGESLSAFALAGAALILCSIIIAQKNKG